MNLRQIITRHTKSNARAALAALAPADFTVLDEGPRPRKFWDVCAAGKRQENDSTRPVTTLRTAWTKVRDRAKVVGRWHDNRHKLVTELAESGAGDEVI